MQTGSFEKNVTLCRRTGWETGWNALTATGRKPAADMCSPAKERSLGQATVHGNKNRRFRLLDRIASRKQKPDAGASAGDETFIVIVARLIV